MSPAERRTLERVARREISRGAARTKTLDSLELRGFISWWSGESPKITEAGCEALAKDPKHSPKTR